MLYKATQTVIEKAPIDAVTGNSRNTLAEERLLKNRVEFETLVKILKFSVWQTDKVICIGTDTTGNVGTIDHYL
jgi:DNA transposition AAA+ family ATPase